MKLTPPANVHRREFLAAAGLAIADGPSWAQLTAGRPVRLIVPYSAGGGIDIAARAIAEGMQEDMGVPVIVDNRPGGSSQVAINVVQQAEPDGTTVLYGSVGAMVTSPQMDPKLSGLSDRFQPLERFRNIAMVGSYDIVVVTGPNGPKSIRELMQDMRDTSKEVFYAQVSVGSATDLASTYLIQQSGGKGTPVRYKGASAAYPDLIAGRITYLIDTPAAIARVKSGQVRGLAVLSKTRFKDLPDVPAVGEIGVPGMATLEWGSWAGLFVRKEVPQAICERLNNAARRAQKMPAVVSRLATIGNLPGLDLSVADSQKYWADEYQRWHIALKTMGIAAR